MNHPFDQSVDELSDDALTKEFTALNDLVESEGYKLLTSYIDKEIQQNLDALGSLPVVDISSFFAREEVISTYKVLQNYRSIVTSRIEELKSQLELNQRKR